jgi:hypothetical protein
MNGVERYTKKTRRQVFLEEMEQVVPLQELCFGLPSSNCYLSWYSSFSCSSSKWMSLMRSRTCRICSFLSVADARHKLAMWFEDYNHRRPHSSLADRTPAKFAKLLSGGKDGDTPALENAPRFPLSHRTATAGNLSPTDQPSTLLLETVT